MNVQAAGAPARVTLKDYELASTVVAAKAPEAPPAPKLDRYTPSDRTAAANPYSNIADSLRVAALRRDAAAPGIGATDRAKTSADDAAIAQTVRGS